MKLFTLEEATTLLPTIRRIFGEIATARAVMQRLAPEVILASERADDGGGGTVFGPQYAKALNTFVAGVQEILGYGVEVKDFDRWLIDFPHLREGKVVYLCWQRGEERIEWWHDVEAGFAGRTLL